MKVLPYEGLHRFLVASSGSDAEMEGLEYLVDLTSEGGIGRCACKNWDYRISPRVTAGEHPVDLFDELFTCIHLRAAREYQLQEFHRVPEAQPFGYEELFWRLMALEPPESTT